MLLAVARDERWEIYLAAALLGSGIGLAFAAMANLIIENVGPEQTGVATGMNTVTRTVGGGFGGAATALAPRRQRRPRAASRPRTATRPRSRSARSRSRSASSSASRIPQRRPEEAFGPHLVGDLADSAS